MEKASHVNIAMIEDTNTNGMAAPKVGAGVDGNKQRCGSTVSFHSIQYKVHQKSGFLCKRKILSKEILVDLKSVFLSLSAVSYSCSFLFPHHSHTSVHIRVRANTGRIVNYYLHALLHVLCIIQSCNLLTCLISAVENVLFCSH